MSRLQASARLKDKRLKELEAIGRSVSEAEDEAKVACDNSNPKHKPKLNPKPKFKPNPKPKFNPNPKPILQVALERSEKADYSSFKAQIAR